MFLIYVEQIEPMALVLHKVSSVDETLVVVAMGSLGLLLTQYF